MLKPSNWILVKIENSAFQGQIHQNSGRNELEVTVRTVLVLHFRMHLLMSETTTVFTLGILN